MAERPNVFSEGQNEPVVADEFSVHSVPISPAATVLLLRDNPSLEVLLVKRTARLVFGPNAWVFPGGRVDADDSHPAALSACIGRSDEDASTALGVGAGGLAWWVAVVRETLEEAGVLLGSTLTGDPADIASIVQQDPSAFLRLIEERSLRFECAEIHPVARFITPLGPPRRFDARFFVARMPGGQIAAHDGGEAVESGWFAPEDALDQWQSGDFTLMSPTVRMLDSLRAFSSTEEVLATAAQQLPHLPVRIRNPENEYRAVLPGDEGYGSADADVEQASVGLYRA